MGDFYKLAETGFDRAVDKAIEEENARHLEYLEQRPQTPELELGYLLMELEALRHQLKGRIQGIQNAIDLLPANDALTPTNLGRAAGLRLAENLVADLVARYRDGHADGKRRTPGEEVYDALNDVLDDRIAEGGA